MDIIINAVTFFFSVRPTIPHKVIPVKLRGNILLNILEKIRRRNPLQKADLHYIKTLDSEHLYTIIHEFNTIFKNYCFILPTVEEY